jgi:hypothetical protein
VKKGYDYVSKRTGQFQTVVTAVISNPSLIDGLDVVVQEPSFLEGEMTYLKVTAKESYEEMEAVQQRLLETLHHLKHRLQYKKRTELALEITKLCLRSKPVLRLNVRDSFHRQTMPSTTG